jgi:hypothetical protein
VKGQSIAYALNERLTEEGLKRVITKTLVIDRRYIDELSPDDLARFITIEPLKMSRGGRVTVRAAKKSRRRQNYLTRVKKEIHILICTNDKKYAALRRQFTQFTKPKSQTALVAMISAGIASYIGVGAGMITPLVAIALWSL